MLTEVLGFGTDGEDFTLPGFRWGYDAPPAERALMGAGTVHHIAWASRDEDHLAWQARVAEAGLGVSDVRDRDYFESIYFGEPRGILFEIATLSPGFAVDEAPESLGEALRLPKQHEHLRPQLEKLLTPVTNPRTQGARPMSLTYRERPASGEAEGLLILHHGRGADEHDLLGLGDTLDPERRLHVVTPRAPLTLGNWPGYHWYVVPRVGYPDHDTFHAAYRALSEFHDEVWERTGIAPERTIFGGFSMGSVMSYSLGLGADRPAPAGILAFSGFIPVVDDWQPDLTQRPAGLHRPRAPGPGDGGRLRAARERPAGRRRARRRVPRVRRRPPHRSGARPGRDRLGRTHAGRDRRSKIGRTSRCATTRLDLASWHDNDPF